MSKPLNLNKNRINNNQSNNISQTPISKKKNRKKRRNRNKNKAGKISSQQSSLNNSFNAFNEKKQENKDDIELKNDNPKIKKRLDEINDKNANFIRKEAKEKADEIAEKIIKEKILYLEEEIKKAKDERENKIEEVAKGQLSKRHFENLQIDPNLSNYKKAQAALYREIENIKKKGENKEIENKIKDLNNNISTLKKDGLEEEKKTQYKLFSEFLERTKYHPISMMAYNLTDDWNHARQLVANIREYPQLEPLVTPTYYDLLRKCKKTFGIKNTAELLKKIGLQLIVTYDNYKALDLLNALRTNPVITPAKIKETGNHLQGFARLGITSQTSLFISSLLRQYTPDEIIRLVGYFDSFTSFRVSKFESLNILFSIQSKFASFQAISRALTAAKSCQWTKNTMMSQFTSLDAASTDEAVLQLINDQALTIYDKAEKFELWIATVNYLLRKKIYTHEQTNYFPLQSFPGLSSTYESIVSLYDLNGHFVDKFVIHTHPGKSNANVKNKDASSKHIKPVTGGKWTARIFWNGTGIPKSLKEMLK